jgi:hypothetical protein
MGMAIARTRPIIHDKFTLANERKKESKQASHSRVRLSSFLLFIIENPLRVFEYTIARMQSVCGRDEALES